MFEEGFPHVQVEVRTFTEEILTSPASGGDIAAWVDSFALDVSGMEEFNQALRNGLITHRGPDVVIWYDMAMISVLYNTNHMPYSLLTFPDLFKTAGWTELFLDLEPLFSADPEFNREDYVQGVFDAGRIGHRQLYVPLAYHLPLLVTTEEALEYFGLDVDFDEELSSTQLMEIIEQFIDENKSNLELFLFPTPDRGIRYVLPWLGEPIIDYYSGTINTHTENFRRTMYSYKMMHEITTRRSYYPLTLLGPAGATGGPVEAARHIFNRDVLFNFTMGYRTFGSTFTPLLSPPESREVSWADDFLNESPVWLPIQDANGAPTAQPVMYAAISRGTSNQYNAYAFLRILMSERWQFAATSNVSYGIDAYPINRQALINAADNHLNWIFDGGVWWRYLPPCTEEEWLEYVWSAVADENFTHTSMQIVYEYMLPFFRGEATFEESLSQLENKLQIYVGE
jgi:hypothetical protein